MSTSKFNQDMTRSASTNTAIVAATSAAATLTTFLALRRYIDRRRWRVKLSKFRRAVAETKRSINHRLMISGEPYDCMEDILSNCRNAAHELNNEYNRPERTAEEREVILHTLLGTCPDDICIEPPIHFDYGMNVHVGRNFFANFNTTILDCAKVTIGDNVFLAPNVQIYTATHPLDAIERRSTKYAKPITIGNDVWIGGGAIILPGVNIGCRVVVAAGAVVTKNAEDDTVVAGVPAKVVKKLK